MKEAERLKRERYKKMMNLLPPMIANKQAPSFFYHAFQRYIDWDSINLNHIQVSAPSRNDPSAKLRKNLFSSKNKLSILHTIGQQQKLPQDDEMHLEMIIAKEEGNPIQFCPYSLQRSALYDKGCITCGKANIIVKYHKDRHICLECRQKITTLNDDPVIIFQNDDGEVVCLGTHQDSQGKKKLYNVKPNELKIFGYRCYVTFSAPDDLIILLDDSQNQNKGIHPNNQGKWACYQGQKQEDQEKIKIRRFSVHHNKNYVVKNLKLPQNDLLIKEASSQDQTSTVRSYLKINQKNQDSRQHSNSLQQTLSRAKSAEYLKMKKK